MTAAPAPLLERYQAELFEYVDAPDEVHLLHAYELGREAADAGDGLLALSEAHHRGVVALIERKGMNGATDPGLLIRRAAEFFSESLASFEMAYQGYRAQIDILEKQEKHLTAAREEAEQANRAKSEFLSAMSHELRTPLNAILGFGHLLDMDDLTADQRESVGHIRTAGAHLLNLINEVLETARIESGHLDLRMKPIPVSQVIQQTLDLTGALAHESGISLRADPTNCHVLADGQRLKQVLLNLVANAIKYNRKNGTIEITCESGPDHKVRIAVTDTGIGIAESAMPQLFLPFVRVGTDYAATEGTGLGLAMVQRFTVAMGGTIAVRSVEGEGTTFCIELAEAAAHIPTNGVVAAPNPIVGATTSSRTVLYVEDDPANAELMKRVFKRIPATTLILASRGGEGLALAREHQPDLVLLDLNLPDTPGQTVLRELQEDPRTSGIPVVMVSADALPERGEQLLSSGVAAYVTKPFDISNLLEIVNAAIAKP